MKTPGPLARDFINRFQGGFPVVPRPFSQVAASLDIGEAALVSMVRTLIRDGLLSRFGPVFDASRLGGAQTLAAMQVPENRFNEVARRVNALHAVAHNYRRDHRLNMWFVIAAEDAAQIHAAVEHIAAENGLPVHEFPKLREFYLGLWLRLGATGSVETVPTPAPGNAPGYRFDDFDRRLVLACQRGLPLDPRPYRTLAGDLDVAEDRVLERMQAMLHHGAIRRIGAVPNHYRLGLASNGMTVWDIDDAEVERVGADLAGLPFVSHCYERPRRPGVWRYNLFAMVHGVRDADIRSKRELISSRLGASCRAGEMLVSSAILKKTGLRLAA